MTLVLLYSLLYLFDISNGDCGTEKHDVPTLGTTVAATIENAQTDHKVIACIRHKSEWSNWRELDNVGCNDREKGSVDYFDTFEDITDEWQAVALYNCGTDGVAITGIQYWDGAKNEEINYFCDNVAGPSVDCYVGDVTPALGQCYRGINDGYYETVWLDQNDESCPAINVATGKHLVGHKSTQIGKIYYKSNPGVPNCDAVLASQEKLFVGRVFGVDTNTNHQTLLSQNVSVGMLMIIVFIGMVIYGVVKIIRDQRYTGYQKLVDNETKYGTLNV